MNFSSILNNDSPPEEKAAKSDPPKQQQRHSLVDLLNDSTPAAGSSNSQNSSSIKSTSVSKIENKSEGSQMSSPESTRDSITHVTDNNRYKESNDEELSPNEKPSTSMNIKRNSIANITNDTDEYMKADEQSIIDSRKSSISDSSSSSSSFNVSQNDLTVVPKTNKPKRYTVPPIWAQEYSPSSKQANNSSAVDDEIPVGDNTALSSKHVFENANLVSVDLECSITGTIPPPSVTRTIAEWIYANFTEIPEEKRKHVELELKFGTIIDKRSGQRLHINVSTECVYTDVSNINFDSGVHEVGFNALCKFLEELEKSYQEELRKNPNREKPKRKFNLLESDITDSFYQIIQRNEPMSKIRISKDNLLSPPRYTAINKHRISDLYIHNPSSMYDLRLSLSYENPVMENEIETIRKRSQPSLTRVKKRSTWSHRPTATRFDMTRVLTPRESKNKMGKKIVEQDQSFEVELEIDTNELFTGFDKFRLGQDSVRFEELVEIFVNNARSLNNRVTKIASK